MTSSCSDHGRIVLQLFLAHVSHMLECRPVAPGSGQCK